MSKLSLSVLAVALLAGCLALMAQEGQKGAAKAAPAAFKPVAPLLVLMENVDSIFTDLKEKIAKEEYKSLKKDAQFLSELFNVASYHNPEKSEWRPLAVKNIEQLKKFAVDSDKRDRKVLEAAYSAINATCDACHEKYRDI